MTTEKFEFKTEVKQILDLMIHSLYSHKEVFLRELISNASDAIDKARYGSLTDSTMLESEGGYKIRITADKHAGILTVSDNGIGMTREEVIEALGTIAHSGTKEFLKALQGKDVKDNPELIGQFGVGFYSSFMVADRITVVSRKAGGAAHPGVKWESTADGTFTVEEVEKEKQGTDVMLHMNTDEIKYLDEWEIRGIVRKYSDFIEHPIVMEVEREKESELAKGKKVTVTEEEILNSRKALWLKERSDISQEEYREFYRHISHDFSDFLKVIHYRAEGTSEFTALLYLPSKLPSEIFYRDFRSGPTLYVKRVQIMEHCEELIPFYLRFVRGVVDSADLPLNVSREILQNNREVEVIRKSITRKVLEALGEMKSSEYDNYLLFYKEFGRILKEGLHLDFSRRETIADLLLFESTKTEAGTYTTLRNYAESMDAAQEAIYYITGTSRDEVLKSPYLEAFYDKGYEVFIMLDEIDDFVMSGFEYRGKKCKSVLKGEISLDKAEEKNRVKAEEKYRKLLELIKERLKDAVKDVRLSGRLKDSVCCLVADDGAMDSRMERLLQAMGQNVPASKKILEINPSHPLFEALEALFEKDGESTMLQEYIELLYDQALLMEGTKPRDPVAFAKTMARLMVESTRSTSS
ncbi:MAG TPA: molecular chaperone HtpG [Thermodesulfovibrionales bacterium]|nr:molecular chaperone HtpG [Thermodesulfovibrionales bacterium]